MGFQFLEHGPILGIREKTTPNTHFLAEVACLAKV